MPAAARTRLANRSYYTGPIKIMKTMDKLKRLFVLLLFVGSFLLAINLPLVVAQSTPGFTEIKWSNVASSPVGTAEAGGAVVDNKLYVFGGFNSRWAPRNLSYVYEPAINSWKRLADTPKPITHTGIAAAGKNIYLAGGYIGKPTGGQIFATREVWRYNIETNTWSAMPPLPQARGSGALTNLKGVLHFFGGADINRIDKGEHWYLPLNGGTKWIASASLPSPRSHLGDVVLGGKIYAVGGQRGYDDNLVTQNSVHVWNPAKPNVWSRAANLPKARSHNGMATFTINGRIIVMGGETAHNVSLADVNAYDPISKSWKALTPLPTKLHSGVGGVIDGKIYYNSGAPTFRTTTYKGTPVLVN